MEKILYNYYQDSKALIIIPVSIIVFALFIYYGIKLYKETLHSYLIEKIIILGVSLLIFVIATIFLGNMAIRQGTIFFRCMNDKCESVVVNKEDIYVKYSPYRDTKLYNIAFKSLNNTLIKPINAFDEEELEKIFSYEEFKIEYVKYRDDIYIYRIIEGMTEVGSLGDKGTVLLSPNP